MGRGPQQRIKRDWRRRRQQDRVARGPRPAARELPDSANAASGPARNTWLAFLGLLAYLLVVLAGVTHVDLLLNSPIKMPIVNVEIPLFGFAVFAPLLLWLFHLGLLIQHAVLGHKYSHFCQGMAGHEDKDRAHPERRLVHNYVFSQLLAGPKPPVVLAQMMRLIVFVTLMLLPVLTLVYFQIKFLPVHDQAITDLHRFALLLDVITLFVVRPLIPVAYLRPGGKKLGLGPAHWRWEMGYRSLGLAGGLAGLLFGFSLLVATFPGEATDELMTSDDLPAALVSTRPGRRVFTPTAWLFENEVGRDSGKPKSQLSQTIVATDTDEPTRRSSQKIVAADTDKPTSWFSRNIVVTDTDLVRDKTDLVRDKNDGADEVSLSLRGRDFRFAVLDRSDLHRADLTKADLRGASATGIRLEKAKLKAAKLQGTNLRGAQLQGANLTGAQLQRAVLVRAELQGANLKNARLEGAELKNAGLQDAELNKARLEGANLENARLHGAVLTDAAFASANLTNAKLISANLRGAQLQGANLTGAQLQGANLKNAGLEGADLRGADLRGADLDYALLPVTDLYRADLRGANLTGAWLKGANLSDANVWQARHPGTPESLLLADLGEDPHWEPLTEEERESLKNKILEALRDPSRQARLRSRLNPLLTVPPPDWADEQAWLKSRESPPEDQLVSFLVRVICDSSDGRVVRSVGEQSAGRQRPRLSSDPDQPVIAVDTATRPLAVRHAVAAALFEGGAAKDCAGRAHLGDKVAAQLKRLVSPPSILEAPPAASEGDVGAFLALTENTLGQLAQKNILAWWDAETNITAEHDSIASATQQDYDAYLLESAKKTHTLSASTPVNTRKLALLKLSSVGILEDVKANLRRTEIVTSMTNNFSKACAKVDKGGPCLTREKIANQLIGSRNHEQLRRLWTAWYDTAVPARRAFPEFIHLTNEGARDSGYADAAVMSRAKYEVDPEKFLKDLDSLWADLQPLYRLLHAYVRSKLVSAYGPSIVGPKGPIPMHLVGNLWGQNWEGIYDLVAFPGASIDYESVIRSRKLGPQGFVSTATNFFESIGFPKLPMSFHKKSYFTRPRSNFVCHPSAWIIAPGDYRLKMCIEENWPAFVTVHHEMGHIFDFQSFSHQTKLFRRSPNNGISEAVGDAITLSITPEYLKRIGLIQEQNKISNELNDLLRVALRKLVRVQFGLMLQKWRWGVLSGEIPPDRYNDAWWELVKKYQGLAPPSPRPKEAFDPGAKFHIAADVDYIRYFLADVLTFQIHEALSQEAGCKLPIHQCTIYGNKRAGARLKDALAMGSSRPWEEMLSALTGKSTISGESMRNYLAPLEQHLKKETAGIPIGW